ncbi:MAG: PAS domain S-box protein [Armatimonadetes bacterium]|nr:PAS domain S-box protein [Armatimonadota bacterium]
MPGGPDAEDVQLSLDLPTDPTLFGDLERLLTRVVEAAGGRVHLVVQNAALLRRLLEERRWLEAAVHQSGNGVLILDRQGMVVGFNLVLERLSGWSLDDAVGKPSHQVFPFEVAGTSYSLQPLAMEGDGPPPVEARLTTREGAPLDVEVASALVRDDRGVLLGSVVTVRDIRARKEKERLERIFLSAVSHELQTPIAIIKGFAGLLSDPEISLPPEQVRQKAAIIEEESARLERMVSQMLLASRLQAGGLKLERETVALEALVARVVEKLEPVAQARGVTLRCDYPGEIAPLHVDAGKIEQVVGNLIENALKYSGGHTVTVRVAQRPWEFEVSVVDEGVGVPLESREQIFQPFERGAQGPGKIHGTGLGLFICKAIVEAHGGHIGVEDAPGRGSRFYFTLPRGSTP